MSHKIKIKEFPIQIKEKERNLVFKGISKVKEFPNKIKEFTHCFSIKNEMKIE